MIEDNRTGRRRHTTPIAALTIATMIAVPTLSPLTAYAVTLDEAKEQLNAISTEFEETSTRIDETEARLEGLKGEIESTENDISSHEDQLREKQGLLSTRMSGEYKSGATSLIDVLFASESLDALSVNMRYYTKASEQDEHLINETRQIKKDLEAKRDELSGKREEEERTVTELRDRSEELSRQQDEAQALVNNLEEKARQEALAAAQARLAAALATRQADAANPADGGETPAGDGAEAPAPVYSGAGNSDVVSFASQFVGTPYVYGGSSPSGFDCSGFVSYVWANYGWSLPHSTYGMISWAQETGRWTDDFTTLQPGDPVFTHSGHVLLTVSPSSDWSSFEVLHAPRPGSSVCYSTLYKYPIGGIRMG